MHENSKKNESTTGGHTSYTGVVYHRVAISFAPKHVHPNKILLGNPTESHDHMDINELYKFANFDLQAALDLLIKC